VATPIDTVESLTEEARATLEGLLPPQWQVDREKGPAQGDDLVDERFSIRGRSGSSGSVLVDARLRPTPAELQRTYTDPLGRRLRASGGVPVLVVAPYLSPRSRDVLETAEVNYLDLTGNARISLDHPGVSVRTVGAQRDPTPRKRPDRGVAGPAAGRIIRTLVDIAPPYTVTEVAGLAGVSPGYCSRTLQALEREALIRRTRRGAVEEVDWLAMLRRRGNAVPLFDERRTTAYVARAGAQGAIDALAAVDDEAYAVTGSFAAARIRAVTVPVGLTVYAREPDLLAASLDLLPVDQGADVRLVIPPDEGVFLRSTVSDDVRWVAPSQVVLDCLGGTGRMPAEGEAVLEWMIENEPAWRRSGRVDGE
jgi:hypothetical protein